MEILPATSKEQIIDPRNSVNELAAVLSTPVGARTIQCQTNFTVRDVLACLQGGAISAAFSCALFLAAARNFMLNIIAPNGVHVPLPWAYLEPAFWACFATGFVVMVVHSLDNRKSLTIDPFGLIINSQVHEGVHSRLLVPWHWLSQIEVKKARFGAAEFNVSTKYGMVYTLRWDEVQMSTVTETLIAAVRTLAPQAEIKLGQVQEERLAAQDSFTDLWLRSLTSSVHRDRIGALQAGTLLNGDRYKIIGFLGSGGQGTAYIAAAQNSIEVVLKEYVLPAHAGSDVLAASQLRIDREVELLKSLDQEHIVKLIDHFVEDYRGYVVLEFVRGEQLKERVIKEGPLDEGQVIKIGKQMCDVLSYLHGLQPQVVHQDISPDNLILQEDGYVKLVDFNVARRFASDSSSLSVVGKLAYIPPEQMRGRPTCQSDIYALGGTLHYLLTAREPDVMAQSHPAQISSVVSKKLNDVIAKATCLNTADRFADAKQFAAALALCD